ncbi:MAG TPA: hypothetical protein VFN38_01910, partial [Gemmatimonadaceae bacterium]|nr:hypothetical protein [Gemmatimonadaceae bacterium]
LAGFQDEMGCGTRVNAFVRCIAARLPMLVSSRVIEFDSTGRTVREWPMTDAPRVGDAIAGVSGEELVTRYEPAPDGVYLRLRPSGEFRISAERLDPLSSQLWVRLDDSGWVRVRPNDNMGLGPGLAAARPGRWIPKGDSGWYVRVDSGPHLGDSGRAQALPFAPTPENVACPAASTYDGMHCMAFPDAGRRRTIAVPIPC